MIRQSNAEKRYGIILFILIISQLFGLYGGMLQAPRILAILFLPLLLRELHVLEKLDRSITIFFFLFFFAGVISIFHSFDNLIVIKEICYIIINVVLFFEIFYFAYKSGDNGSKIICFSYTTFLLATIPIAIYEIMFNWHFSNAKFGDDSIVGGLGIVKRYAAITFGNYNLYNHLLVIALPFYLATFSLVSRRFNKVLLILGLACLVYIILINGSRGALVCSFFVIFLYFQFFYFRKGYARVFASIAIVLGGFYLFLYVFSNENFVYIANRLNSSGFEDNSRLELIKKGLEITVNTNFIGTGAGNFGTYVARKYPSMIQVPHNLHIEILAQYGLIVFISFLVVLFRLFYRIKAVSGLSRFVLLGSLLTFPLAFVINSVYLSNPYLWIYLASLFVVGYREIDQKKVYVS